MAIISLLFVTIELLCVFPKPNRAADAIRPTQFLRNGSTLVSNGGRFELGFFSPGSNPNRLYLGIWYKTIPVRRVVWVANRDKPIEHPPATLTLNGTGSLVLLGRNQSVVWSTISSKEAANPAAQLLDTGNFVLRDEQRDTNSYSANFLWQSFDYPSDTLLPGMKLGWDLRTGFVRRLTSWKSSDDPSPGELIYGVELHSYPEAVMRRGSTEIYRSGPWNGLRYSGAPELRPNPLFHFEFNANLEEVYYTYQLNNDSVISILVLNGTSSAGQRYIWIEDQKRWNLYVSLPRDNCDTYSLCGAYGICVINESPVCQCLKGFTPKSPGKWNNMNWSQGCARNKPLKCGKGDGFAKFDGLKLPDTTHSWVNRSMNLKECRAMCLANCSCVAYTKSDIRGGGSGCAMWFGDLMDMRQLPIGGQELCIRMPDSELGANHFSMKQLVIIVAVIAVYFGIIIVGYCICRRRRKTKENDIRNNYNNERQERDLEMPSFDLASIVNATSNFSVDKKLGEGGFGPVYKGVLLDGQEIAVKRLSMSSGQGVNEFKNEVTLIAKLQHRNLVKFLGCCIEGDERMLIYEYMPNKSLDFFIFDETKGKLLDWSKRYHIIFGIARGLLYLHQDSRLRIIHRDLKASNVLLDNEMNAKISDFGLARCFGSSQTMANTIRVVGTYGYMAPEYVVDGLFSIKSDVFSFGVLLLEIVIGKKNRGFYHSSHNLNLIGHAWRLWKEGRALELVNGEPYEVSCHVPTILRCIHVGLLCVQQQPEDRPNMSSVLLLLSSEGTLPQPNQPGFFVDRSPVEVAEYSSNKYTPSSSTNDITITHLEAR
ncbi:G-type lectin S-receptor-like serine/threonine-protein kinase At4g27290 isoform X2 [Malania oleifera]|uniref:G-type lectin S-receptor-like serine/threonine-protein kinase At4g27290 isoform X2 n=1 Tax=Malania oleifera TaxID=397392 RepID=UPI0025AEADD6|nr:G-type lectin S-receptor-like serine/threonine-protein kinase At4g27290 isoform X2 [Malania oleifera]